MEPLFERARAEALALHSGQMYGFRPYSFHLDMVCAELARINASLAQRIGGLFHDSIEAGLITRMVLARRHGADVDSIVWACTHEGGNRREQAQCIVSKLEVCPRAIDVKLADRKCNMLTSYRDSNGKLFSMYLKEVDVYEPVFARGNLTLYKEYRELCGLRVVKS